MPTDDRFTKLSEKQKTLLYYMAIHSPTLDQLKMIQGMEEAKKQREITEDEEDALRKDLGMSEDEIATVREQLDSLTEAEFVSPDNEV